MPKKAFPDIIKNLKIFRGVADEVRDAFISEGVLVYCKRGDNLFRQGDPIKDFYIVCSGVMQLFTETPDGRELTVDVATAGRTMAKSEAILNPLRRHYLSAKSIADSVVLKFPISWLKKVSGNPIIAMNILVAVSQYAHMVEIESEHKSTMTAAQQVGCFLQRLCVMHGFDPMGFELPYSKVLIASRLGMEPETFSRALAKLRGNGIEVCDNWVAIKCVDTVADYICDKCSMSVDCPTHQSLSEKMKVQAD